MKSSNYWLPLVFCIGFFLILAQSVAVAQEQKSKPIPATLVTTEVLKSKIAEAEAATSLEEQTRNRLIELYRNALTNLEKMSSYQADADTFAKARNIAPIETEELRKALEHKEKRLSGKSLKISEQAPLSELEQQLEKEKADFAAVEAKLSDLKKQQGIQLERPGSARQRLIDARRQQDAVLIERKAAHLRGSWDSVKCSVLSAGSRPAPVWSIDSVTDKGD